MSRAPRSTDAIGQGVGTAEKVADAIRMGIRTGQFVPGQHLVEIDLTQRLQISRSSLREALQHLHGDGVVTMNRFRGTHICRLSRKSVDDLLEVLEVLVRLAARRATRSTKAKRALMDAAVDAADRHKRAADHTAYLSVRQAFYDALFEISENEELPRVTPLRRADLFRAQIRPYQSLEEQNTHVHGYRAIAEAVMGGDEEGAESAVRAHFAATRTMIDRLPEAAFAHG